jgi:hypothetical protein
MRAAREGEGLAERGGPGRHEGKERAADQRRRLGGAAPGRVAAGAAQQGAPRGSAAAAGRREAAPGRDEPPGGRRLVQGWVAAVRGRRADGGCWVGVRKETLI